MPGFVSGIEVSKITFGDSCILEAWYLVSFYLTHLYRDDIPDMAC